MQDERVMVLSIGQMDAGVESALSASFRVVSAGAPDIDAVAQAHASEIMAVVLRGHAAFTAAMMDRLPKVEIIANFGVGYDTIDVDAAAKRGIVVTNTPDVLNDEVADSALGLLIATVRKLPQADRFVRSGAWAAGEKFPLTSSLRGRSIGIAGMGRIGSVIAKRLEGFDLPISYFGRRPQPGIAYPFYSDLAAMAKAVDTLIVVLPGTQDTRHLVDATVLFALGSQGVLINVSRGSVVDEEALIHALQQGTILSAGLDVYEHEPDVPAALRAIEQVVLLPHVGSGTRYTRERMGELQVQNIVSWFQGTGPITPVKETPSTSAIKRK